jgi:hypothetical protein
VASEQIPTKTAAGGLHGIRTERRIAWLTLAVGFVSAAIALSLRRSDWALGLGFGAALGWLNFQWMRRGASALSLASAAQAGRENPKLPRWSYVAVALRYGLIGLGVCVIFIYLHVPLASLILGLCALGAATIAASVWEITSSSE